MRTLRRWFLCSIWRILAKITPDGTEPVPDLKAARKILLVLVNNRPGNTIWATPDVSALLDALPMAEFSFVGGPQAPAIFNGYNLKMSMSSDERISGFSLPRCSHSRFGSNAPLGYSRNENGSSLCQNQF